VGFNFMKRRQRSSRSRYLPIQIEAIEAVGKDAEGSADLVNHGRRICGIVNAQHAGRKCTWSLQILT